jgi:hypothetical protein
VNQIKTIGLLVCFGGHLFSCKPPTDSRLKVIATANSLKTGIFMPERTEDLAKSSGTFSGSSLSANELMQKLKINPTKLPAGIRYTVPTQEQDLILVIRQAPGARPIPLGGISKSGQTFYFSTSLAAVQDTPYVAIGKTFFKMRAPNEPLKITVSPDGNQSNAYQVITVQDGLGGLEEYLISYLNVLVSGDKDPVVLVKIGNRLVSPTSGKTMVEFREVGNQVWVVAGGISNKYFKNGSVIWSTNMKEFYSIRMKGQAITQWRKQDNNSMDVAAEGVNVKIPAVVSELLDRHANDAEIMGDDKLISGPTFGTISVGASSLVDRLVRRVASSSNSSSQFSLSSSDDVDQAAPSESSGEAFETFFQPGRVAGGLSLGDGSSGIPLPSSQQLAKEGWLKFNQDARPGTKVALPGGAVGTIIGRTSVYPSSSETNGETSHHYLIQDDMTNSVYKVDHARTPKPGFFDSKSWGFGRTADTDSEGRTISSSIRKLPPSEVATLGSTAQQYREQRDASWKQAQVEIQKFSAAQQHFDNRATAYMDKWSPVDMDAPPGQWRANMQGIGNYALLVGSAVAPSEIGGSKALGSLVKGQYGLATAIVNNDGASMAANSVSMPADVILSATGMPYADAIKTGLKVGTNQGVKFAEGNFDGIDFGTTAASESISTFGGKLPGPYGLAAKMSKPVIEGVGTLGQAVPMWYQQRQMEVPMDATIRDNNMSSLYRQGAERVYIPPKYSTMQPTITTNSYGSDWVGGYSSGYSSKPISTTTNRLITDSFSTSTSSSAPLVLKPITPATMQTLPSNSIPKESYVKPLVTNSTLSPSVNTTTLKPYVSPTTSTTGGYSSGSSYGGSSYGGSSYGGSTSSGSSSGISTNSTMGSPFQLKEP